jgi:hypothetical protein
LFDPGEAETGAVDMQSKLRYGKRVFFPIRIFTDMAIFAPQAVIYCLLLWDQAYLGAFPPLDTVSTRQAGKRMKTAGNASPITNPAWLFGRVELQTID